MESPRKFNDCYFYYYSTCTKGDNCVFRHEPAALGCETMCTAWQQGKCLDKRCKLRHMELRKNRKQIPCYWENQPGGCRKKHCPFMHKNPDARTDGIAPSQPAPAQPQPPTSVPQGGVGAAVAAVSGVTEVSAAGVEQALGVAPVPVPAPAPVPLLWQQQRQAVVLDSAILGVLPSSELLGGRRPMPHETAYAPLPVDPLVVNFEEESDNESAPSSTPTKAGAGRCGGGDERASPSRELQLLEKIQAEAAAFYSYAVDEPPKPKAPRHALAAKYDRLSLDEIAGRRSSASDQRRTSLDFKVMSLDEIRANRDSIVHGKPITLTLNRKRKLSTHETITSTGKMIKVVRSNSVVYKKMERVAQAAVPRCDSQSVERDCRKRTLSEQSDVVEIRDDELDDCYRFKRIRPNESGTPKPRLIRAKQTLSESEKSEEGRLDTDSDHELQIIDADSSRELKRLSVSTIELEESTRSIDIIDLCDDSEPTDEIDLSGIPDVVASCRTGKGEPTSNDIIKNIDSIINDESL